LPTSPESPARKKEYQKMKNALRVALAVMCLSLFSVTALSAQVPYNEGNVERVVLIHILPGHYNAFMEDLKTNILPIWEADEEGRPHRALRDVFQHHLFPSR
jgi:hypothetical protein